MLRLVILLAVTHFLAAPLEARLRAGVAAIPITPFGNNPEWKGPVGPTGVWGDATNRIWMAGFGNNRPAEGRHDDLWVRALVLEADGGRVALVAMDVVGYYQDAGFYGVDHALKLLPRGQKLDAVIVSSTHNHEGPDTIGLWGPAAGRDGKYADYLRFVDRQLARALNEAADPGRMAEVRARFGALRPATLRGLQVRTGHRPPNFFDEELRVMQLTMASGARRGKVLATLINWNTHPESMESRNRFLTSDFPHYLREAVEKKYGGTAVYFSGAIGAAEIIGDAAMPPGVEFEQIGERRFPLDPKTRRPPVSFERTRAIGETVAAEVFRALERGEELPVDSLRVRSRKISARATNPDYLALHKAGLLGTGGETVTTTLYHLALGPAEFITLPGEVFPELLYGVEQVHRTDCPEAHTGRPWEPAVWPHLKAKYKFILGLANDELGYVVPLYDFVPLPPQPWRPGGRQPPDACAFRGVPSHYHETNSVGYEMAPAVTCGLVQLLGGDVSQSAACAAFRPAP